METSEFLALGSLVISGIAVIYSYTTNTKKFEISNVLRQELFIWYSETIELMKRLSLEAHEGFPDIVLKRELLAKLSSKIDMGRFYFPNIDVKDGFGKDKPRAFQGYRNLILDFLVLSYELYENVDVKNYHSQTKFLERHFTSHFFELIQPNNFLSDSKRTTGRNFVKELRMEDFLECDLSALNDTLNQRV
jgi:hypothetical protein